LSAWEDACRKAGGSSNVFESGGVKYFFESSRKEHRDGAITGTIWKHVDETHCRKAGSFRINRDGSVARAHKWLKDRSPSAETLNAKYRDLFGRPCPEEVVATNHARFAAVECV
jgi:hypothetical protein